jgi:hypothetical protein
MDIMRIAGSRQLVRYCNKDAGVTYTVDAGRPPPPGPPGGAAANAPPLTQNHNIKGEQ